MTTKTSLRILGALAVVSAALLLAGCNGLGANTGSVTLTVYNGNSAGAGTAYSYTNVYVDGKTLVSTDIKPGDSATAKIDSGQHFMSYTYNGTYHDGTGSGDSFYVSSSATTYTWNGPTG